MAGPYLTWQEHEEISRQQDEALTTRLGELAIASEREEDELGLESPREFGNLVEGLSTRDSSTIETPQESNGDLSEGLINYRDSP